MRRKLFFVAVELATCALLLCACYKVECSNSFAADCLITCKYPIEKVQILKEKSAGGDLRLVDLKKLFHIECLRETHQGYYTIILHNSGDQTFVFMNGKKVVTNVMTFSEFKTKNEFENYILEQRTIDEIRSFDPNYIPLPFSTVQMTAHLVQEGLFLVKYTSVYKGSKLEKAIVFGVQFVENNAISTYEDPFGFIRDEIPFILEIDKQKGQGQGDGSAVP